ncbi:MAG: hydroxyethylthiazole kinase [Candidatus Aquicultorales bacterium]
MKQTIARNLRAVRDKKPLVHNITNYVVMNETANALLCIGALPVMAHAVEEMEEMVGIADTLVVNIGTLSKHWVEAMIAAGKAANAKGIPVILDPVGAGATSFRTETCRSILDQVDVAVVRGNAGEISVLAGIGGEVKGVESVGHAGDIEKTAAELAAALGCVVAVTGAVDVVSDGRRTARVSNGSPMLGRVTGTGCMSSTMVAAFAGANTDRFEAAVGALVSFGLAGELAAAESDERPGTFHVALYDALALLSEGDIEERAQVELVEYSQIAGL